ncbi:MAG: STAS domain-containing protein [Acidobacteriales bacterium]|nr:STAS domain-containing protein [Terriglobales bacterium]
MGLQIEIRQVDGITILDMHGRATIGLANDLLNARLRQVVEGGARKILINLTTTSQIDSSGISTLVRTFVTLSRNGGSLKLYGPNGRVREVLEVTRLLTSIPTFKTEAEALASYK